MRDRKRERERSYANLSEKGSKIGSD